MSATLSGIIGGAPSLLKNLLIVYIQNTIQYPANGGLNNIAYDTIQKTSTATSYDPTTALFTLNFPGKYLFNFNLRLNTSASNVFSPNLSLYLQMSGLTQGSVGRQFFFFFSSASNGNQGTMNFNNLVVVPDAGETCSLQLQQQGNYGGGFFPAVGSIAQGSRSTVLYLGS